MRRQCSSTTSLNSVANKVLLAETSGRCRRRCREAIQPELPAIQQKVFDYISAAEKVAKPIDPPDPKAHTQILAGRVQPDHRPADVQVRSRQKKLLPSASRPSPSWRHSSLVRPEP